MRQSLKPVLVQLAFTIFILSFTTHTAHAQSRIGYISMSELIQAMPEYKKADSAMTNYQDALYQRQTQAFYQQINQLLQQKQDELLAPIRKKANDLIWQLAKEHGYTYVLLKETIAVYPLTDDLMPYAKQKLGLK
jgi:outer membrane protein